MNAAHVVALDSHVLDGTTVRFRASRWTSGVLASIHPAAAGIEDSYCLAVNSLGHILGWFDDDNPFTDKRRAFLDIAGTTTIIGSLGPNTLAYALNDSDVVVGEIESGANYLPFRWTAATGIQTITPLSPATTGAAKAINNAGDIVGTMGDFAFLRRADTTHKLIDLIAGIPGATGWTSLNTAQFINDNNDIVGYGFYLGEYKAYRLHLPP